VTSRRDHLTHIIAVSGFVTGADDDDDVQLGHVEERGWGMPGAEVERG
jgi:hypothetical protein